MKTIIVILLLLGFVEESFCQPVWNQQNSGTTNNLNRIYFNASVSGGLALFIVGDNGTILKSNNSGLFWETINSNTSSNLYSIAIDYRDTGYAVGSNGTIIKSIDGGNNWNVIPSSTSNALRDVKIINSSLAKAIAVGENGTFLKLVNNVWTSSQIDTSNLNSIAYASGAGQWLTVGNSGAILKTTNYGVN